MIVPGSVARNIVRAASDSPTARRPSVGERHRTTQRDAPEPPAVPLTDDSRLFEVGFGTLLIDLGGCGIDQAQRQGYQAEPRRKDDDVSAHSSSES